MIDSTTASERPSPRRMPAGVGLPNHGETRSPAARWVATTPLWSQRSDGAWRARCPSSTRTARPSCCWIGPQSAGGRGARRGSHGAKAAPPSAASPPGRTRHVSSPRAGSWRTGSAAACIRVSRAWPRSTTSSMRVRSTSPPASTRWSRPSLAGTRSTGARGRPSSTSAYRSGSGPHSKRSSGCGPSAPWNGMRTAGRRRHRSIAGRGPRSSRPSASTRAPAPSSRQCGRPSRPFRGGPSSARSAVAGTPGSCCASWPTMGTTAFRP